jgi:enolase-phosphatase E1
MAGPQRIRGVLLDVEGTTTPIAFVRDTLFPYAAARLDAACANAAGDARIAGSVERLRAEHAAEPNAPAFGDGAPYARWLMQRDRKSPGLKALQGLIWDEGYRSGELRAPLFPDVPAALSRWREIGLAVRIFSSGSVLAQRLLFAHTDHGDVTGWIAGYHDTTTGAKTDPRSYATIATAFGLAPEQVLFLSDSAAELAAARSAGMDAGFADRPGNGPVPDGSFPRYADFRSLGL